MMFRLNTSSMQLSQALLDLSSSLITEPESESVSGLSGLGLLSELELELELDSLSESGSGSGLDAVLTVCG